jgi:hypothetical protein
MYRDDWEEDGGNVHRAWECGSVSRGVDPMDPRAVVQSVDLSRTTRKWPGLWSYDQMKTQAVMREVVRGQKRANIEQSAMKRKGGGRE